MIRNTYCIVGHTDDHQRRQHDHCQQGVGILMDDSTDHKKSHEDSCDEHGQKDVHQITALRSTRSLAYKMLHLVKLSRIWAVRPDSTA